MIEKLIKLNIIKSNGKINSKVHTILSKYPMVKNDIWKITAFLDNNAVLIERIFCIQNNITTKPICDICNTYVKFITGPPKKYQQFCSTKCSNNDINKIKLFKQTKLTRYGNENYTNIKKRRKTCLNRYNRIHQTQEHISTDSLDKLNDKKWLIEQHYDKCKSLVQIANDLNINNSTVSIYLRYHGLETIYRGGRNEQYFETYPEKRTTPAHLYIIHCYNENESFIKIGITENSIKQRFNYFDYNYDILLDIELPLYIAFKAEQDILNQFKEHSYQPIIKFDGQTECLNEKCYEDIIKHLQ